MTLNMLILLCTIAKKHGKTLTKHAGDRCVYLISCSTLANNSKTNLKFEKKLSISFWSLSLI